MKNKTRKRCAIGAVLLKAGGSFFGCSDSGSSGGDENQAPNTEIITGVKDDGTVDYTIKGTDSDGSINYILVNINGKLETVPNNYTKNVPIVEGNNTITATAYDNEEKADSTPASETNYSPTDLEASESIGNCITGYTSDIQKNAWLALGDNPLIQVNILSKTNGVNTVVDYLETNGDLIKMYLGSKNYLGIPNRTFSGELERKAIEFYNNLK